MKRNLIVMTTGIFLIAAAFLLTIYQFSTTPPPPPSPPFVTPHTKPVGAQGDSLSVWSYAPLFGKQIFGQFYSLAVQQQGEFVDKVELYASLNDYQSGVAALSSYQIPSQPWSLCASPHDFRAWSRNLPGDTITFSAKVFSLRPIFGSVSSTPSGVFNYSTKHYDASKPDSFALNVLDKVSQKKVRCATPTSPCPRYISPGTSCTISCPNPQCFLVLDY